MTALEVLILVLRTACLAVAILASAVFVMHGAAFIAGRTVQVATPRFAAVAWAIWIMTGGAP